MARLAALAEAGARTVYSWAHLPNHTHLLFRTDHRWLARAMRSFLTSYAGATTERGASSGTGTNPSSSRRSRIFANLSGPLVDLWGRRGRALAPARGQVACQEWECLIKGAR